MGQRLMSESFLQSPLVRYSRTGPEATGSWKKLAAVNRPCQNSRFNLRQVSASAKQGRCNGADDGGAVREKPQTDMKWEKVKIKNMSHLQALVPSHNLFHLDFALSPYTACWWTSCTPSAPLFEPPDSRLQLLLLGLEGEGPEEGPGGPLVSRQGWPNAPNLRQSRRRVSDSQTRRDRFVSPVSQYGNHVNT